MQLKQAHNAQAKQQNGMQKLTATQRERAYEILDDYCYCRGQTFSSAQAHAGLQTHTTLTAEQRARCIRNWQAQMRKVDANY
jgi:hypothetical protein